MSLRSPVTTSPDPFRFSHTIPTDDAYAPPARHARRRPHGEPLPGSLWVLFTLVAWAMAVLATLLSVAIFGGARNGLWLLAIVFYMAGIVTFLRAWGRE